MKKVACFFTGGYTESGAMQDFLKKINPQIILKQFCPNKPKRRWRPGVPFHEQMQIEKDMNGLTGEGLISYVYNYIETHLDEIVQFDAMLIEDDLDNRFFIDEIPGDIKTRRKAKTQEFIDYCQEVSDTIRTKLSKAPDYPVIQLYASPEIESWFLGDWEHSFGCIYGPRYEGILNHDENEYFGNRFQTYIRSNIVKEYIDCIEHYGYFEGNYHKLSKQLEVAITGDFKVKLNEQPNDLAKRIAKNRNLYYSKRIHGDLMLRNLSPEILANNCPEYYAPAIADLKCL